MEGELSSKGIGPGSVWGWGHFRRGNLSLGKIPPLGCHVGKSVGMFLVNDYLGGPRSLWVILLLGK